MLMLIVFLGLIAAKFVFGMWLVSRRDGVSWRSREFWHGKD